MNIKIIIGIIIVFGLCSLGITAELTKLEIPKKDFSNQISYQISEIVNGNTIVLIVNGKKETVRLAGVTSPKSTELFVTETSAFTRNMLLGELVYVEAELKIILDEYGHMFVYLYRSPDYLFVNLEIIRQGYGRTNTIRTCLYMDLFQQYEYYAKKSSRGLWKKNKHKHQLIVEVVPKYSNLRTTSTDHIAITKKLPKIKKQYTVYRTSAGKKYHKSGCSYLSKSSIPIYISRAKSIGLTRCSRF